MINNCSNIDMIRWHNHDMILFSDYNMIKKCNDHDMIWWSEYHMISKLS